MTTKQVACCVCEEMITPTLVLENMKDGWHIVRCPQCDLTFVHPQPPSEIISAYYNGMYSDLATEFSEEKMKWAQSSIKEYCNRLARLHPQAKSLLDLGGGLGYYSKAFADAGYSVTLVEQDPVSARFAREHLKLDIVIEKNDVQFFKENDRQYDIVFMRHVIEHSTKPGSMIHQVAKCLSNSGILIIETDNNKGIELLFRPGTAAFYTQLYHKTYARAFYFNLLKVRPFAVDPPRHLFGFRETNLGILLTKNSLYPKETICYRLGHPAYWPNMPMPTLRDCFEQLRKFQVAHFIASMLDWLALPIRLFLERRGMASGICIYAVKDASKS